MTINITPEQLKELKDDGYLDIKLTDEQRLYVEIAADDTGMYFEYFECIEGAHRAKFCFDREELNRLIPQRPHDPSYYRNDPLCPNCGSYMLYHFEHCPKCGQKLDWSEK